MEFKGTYGKWVMRKSSVQFESYTVTDYGKIIGYSTQNTKEAQANELLRSKALELLEQLHTLAMMTLQSDFYHDYPDFKREVDNSLALIKSATD